MSRRIWEQPVNLQRCFQAHSAAPCYRLKSTLPLPHSRCSRTSSRRPSRLCIVDCDLFLTLHCSSRSHAFHASPTRLLVHTRIAGITMQQQIQPTQLISDGANNESRLSSMDISRRFRSYTQEAPCRQCLIPIKLCRALFDGLVCAALPNRHIDPRSVNSSLVLYRRHSALNGSSGNPATNR